MGTGLFVGGGGVGDVLLLAGQDSPHPVSKPKLKFPLGHYFYPIPQVV